MLHCPAFDTEIDQDPEVECPDGGYPDCEAELKVMSVMNKTQSSLILSRVLEDNVQPYTKEVRYGGD